MTIALPVVLTVCFALQTSVFADDDASSDPVQVKAGENSSATTTLNLPQRLPDGRPVRSIGIADSQKFELIPPGYYPVQTQDLVGAIERWRDSVSQSPNSPLRSCEYLVDLDAGMLVCQSGYVEVEPKAQQYGIHLIGKASFALLGPEFETDDFEPAKQLGSSANARIVSRQDGNLVALIDAPASDAIKIPVRWRQRGDPGPRGYQFKLTFPKSPQTRFIFSTKRSVRLMSEKGVLRELQVDEIAVDKATDNDSVSGDVDGRRRYELDAGGLDSVVLKTQVHGVNTNSEAVVIRRNSAEYNLDSAGLSFTQRIEIGLPSGMVLPRLRVLGVPLTSVKVNASEASFVPIKSPSTSVFDYQIVPPAGAIGVDESRVSLTLKGQSTWRDVCALPLAGLMNGADRSFPVVDACTRDEARVSLNLSAKIVDWKLPEGWLRQSTIDGEGISVATATGVSLANEFNQLCESNGRGSSFESWSTLRLSKAPQYRVRDLWLLANVEDTLIECEARFHLQLAQPGISPLRFYVQPGWNIDRISFLDSSRVLERPDFQRVGSVITVWPEYEDMKSNYADGDQRSDDFDQGFDGLGLAKDDLQGVDQANTNGRTNQLRLEVRGTRGITGEASTDVVPEIWMVRACDPDNKPILSDDFTAGISPPEKMNWAGDTAMTPHRIDIDQLDEDTKRFLGGDDAAMLYFKPRHRQIDPLSLKTPNVDLEVNLQKIVTKTGNQISEELWLDIVSGDQNLDALTVQTGPSAGLPKYRWVVSDASETETPGSLSPQVELRSEESEGTYKIDLAGKDQPNRKLIAFRSFAAKDMRVSLPTVPKAISTNAQLFLGRGLRLAGDTSGLQRIPRLNLQTRLLPFDSLDGAHFRCDTAQQQTFDVAIEQEDHRINVIGQFRVRMVASSRGLDRIELRMTQASISTPLVIRCNPELQIASVMRDGQPVEMNSSTLKPIVLPPLRGRRQGQPEDIQIVMDRSKLSLHVMRTCQIPRFDLNATVMNERYEVVAATDSFAPRSLLYSSVSTRSSEPLAVLPEQGTLLIRRDLVLAAGWLIAIIVFSGSWLAMNRWPYLVFGSLLLMAMADPLDRVVYRSCRVRSDVNHIATMVAGAVDECCEGQ